MALPTKGNKIPKLVCFLVSFYTKFTERDDMMHVMCTVLLRSAAILANIIITSSNYFLLSCPVGTVADSPSIASTFPSRVVGTSVDSRYTIPFIGAFTATEVMLCSFDTVWLTIKNLSTDFAKHFNSTPSWMFLSDKVLRHPLSITFHIAKQVVIGLSISFGAFHWFSAVSTFNYNAVVVMMFLTFLILFLTFRSTFHTTKVVLVSLDFVWWSFYRLSTIVTVYYRHFVSPIVKMPQTMRRLLFGQLHFTSVWGMQKTAYA